MTAFPDIIPDLKAKMPDLRGRLAANQTLDPFTWFRVGGPAQMLFVPEDAGDLAYFLQHLPNEIPLTVIGAASNMIVRDGGVPGAVVRMGRGFNEAVIQDNHRVLAGAAMLDVMVARAAQKASIAGLAFLSGIPGTVGGALCMNAGAYGGETKDVLIEAYGLDRQGNARTYSNADMGFSYRHSGIPDDVIFTGALLQGRAGNPDQIAAEMADDQSQARSQPAAQSHRRLDLQESARPERLEADRRRRLPRAHHRRRAGLRTALQFSDQSRQRDGQRYRNAWRNRARTGQGQFRHHAGMGN